MSERSLIAVLALFLACTCGCAGPPDPAPLDAPGTLCGQCRQAIANPRVAAQLGAPGREPVFFDDIQCLAEYLQNHTALPRNAIAFVTDHRTGEWTLAAAAVYTRNLAIPTPAASHLIAHASPASRDQDPASQGGLPVAVRQLYPLGAPEGVR